MEREVLIESFWPPYLGDGDPKLYSDELGWREFHQIDAKSKNSKNIFDFYVDYYAFNLILYIVKFDEFMYIDAINGNVFLLSNREDWDGKFIYERCEFTDYPEVEPEYIFEFEDAQKLWNEFKYKGLSLYELISCSDVDTQH